MRRPLTPLSGERAGLRLSLRAYLILLVVASVLPVALFALWLTVASTRAPREALRDGMQDTARALAVAVDRDLRDAVHTLQAVAASRSLDSDDTAAVRDEMRRIAATRREWQGIALHTVDGRCVLDTATASVEGVPRDPERVRPVVDTNGPVISTGGPADAVAVRVPVQRDGRVRYVLSASLLPAVLGEILARQDVPDDWIGSLVDGHGVLVARNRDASAGKGKPTAFPVSGADPRQGWGGRADLPEGQFYFAYARPELADWRVVLAAPVAALDGAWWQSRGAAVGGGVAFLVAGVVLATLAVRPITRSLSAVADAAADLGRGRTPPPIGFPVVDLEVVGRDLEAAGRIRETVERARHDSEAQLSALVNQTTAAIAQTDLQGRFMLVNRRYCEMVGRPPHELIGHSLEEVVHPDDRPRAAGAVRGLTPDEPERAVETRYLRPDGSVRWVDASLSLVRDEEASRSVTIVALDASGRHAAEDAARASDSRFRLMADAAPVLVWMAGPDTRRTWFNSQWIAFVGRDLDRELGAAWLEHVHPDDRARCAETSAREFEARRRFDLEYRLRWYDGTYRWVRDDGVPLYGPDGAFIGYIGACVDVTGHKLAELDLLAREQTARREAEAAGQAKDEFLAVLSHELRTPLNALRLWAGILRTGPPDPQTLQRAVEAIDRNAVLQARLIDDLMDVSRIVSGRLRLATERVELGCIVEAALETARVAADNRSVALTTALDPGTGAVIGDRARLQQVVWNLVANAVRFTPPGGRVQIGLRRVGREAELTVADSGRGIAPGLLPRVFDRFRQGESGTTRSHGGLGLGLSIVRQLVELHGGTIRAASAGEGHGAIFTVCLPSAESRIGPPSAAVPAGRPDGSDRTRILENVGVLVVDDDPETREVMAVALGHEGARVTTVPSVAEAVAALERGWPDVLVSDIGMPGKDGYDLIRAVRRLEAPGGRHLPAIAVTAYASAEDRRRSLEAGYEAHVAKPVEAAIVAPLIASLLPTPPPR